ncbi:MAG: nucleotidyltransferase domain-containing protein [Candidatus Omnitrophica bacterium]|nr:nucleotidyltransferase domain-containing protein [Candidatus Omnitrophota bacterium]
MLIPAGRKKILEMFLRNPFQETHLREIARLSKVSLTNVDNSMKLFVKNDMFKKREMLHSTFFKPNLENDDLIKVFELLELDRRKEFYLKSKNIARLLKKYTESIVALSNKRIQMVILFGSVARSEWIKGSDIDILAVVSDKENEITDILNNAKTDASPLLEIRSISTTVNKITEGLRVKAEFYNNIWNDRIILYNEFLFWQLIKEGGRRNA